MTSPLDPAVARPGRILRFVSVGALIVGGAAAGGVASANSELLISAAALDVTWSPPITISAAGQSAQNPQMSIASDGLSAIAIWARNDGRDDRAQVSVADIDAAATTWSPAQTISGSGSGVNDQRISMSADGSKAIATWYREFEREVDDEDEEFDVVETAVATIVDGVMDWSATTEMSEFIANGQEPQVSISADGSSAAAIWNLGRDKVQVSIATITGKTPVWSPAVTLYDAGVFVSRPQIVISADGASVTAVWSSRDGGLVDIVQSASASVASGVPTWSAVSDLSAPGQRSEMPDLALAGDGSQALAVWRFGSGSAIQSATASITAGTPTWSAATNVYANAGEGTGIFPKAVLAEDGSRAAVVWDTWDGGGYTVRAATGTIAANTATWSAYSSLSAPGLDGRNSSIALSADGASATATWRQNDGTRLVIQSSSAQIAGGTAEWTDAVNLSDTSSNSFAPTMGLSASGGTAVAAWYTSDGSHDVVQASVATIAEPAPPVPPTPAPAVAPSAPAGTGAVAGDGSAVVTWTPPVSAGSFAVTYYHVADEAGAFTCLTVELSCVAGNLVNGEEYSFRVRALNGAGWGPWSAASNTVTPIRPVTPTIVVSGDRSRKMQVMVSGSTTGLAGATVQSWVKLAGQDQFAMGSVRIVDAEGDFAWQRRANRTVSVYFTSQGVRSERIVIPAR